MAGLGHENLKAFVHAAEGAPSAVQQSRKAVCRAIAEGLDEVSRILLVQWVGADERCRGLALLTRECAQLAAGTVRLFDTTKLYYAGSALTRQVIECQYLFWRFAEDPEEARRWFRSPPDEVRQVFSPQALRKSSAGLFRDQEYWNHCNTGGHPSAAGSYLLEIGVGPAVWLDLAEHLVNTWGFLLEAINVQNMAAVASDELRRRILETVEPWVDAEDVRVLDVLSMPYVRALQKREARGTGGGPLNGEREGCPS